jgi:hypothetical protein
LALWRGAAKEIVLLDADAGSRATEEILLGVVRGRRATEQILVIVGHRHRAAKEVILGHLGDLRAAALWQAGRAG